MLQASELRATKEAEDKATTAKTEARSQAVALNDEVGLLRSQLTSSSKKEATASADKSACETKLQKMEELTINQTKVLNDLRKKYISCNEARKAQKGSMNTLLDIVKRSESEAKAANAAVKSGKKAAPVLSVLRYGKRLTS